MQKGSKAKWCLNKAKPEMKVDKSELRKRLTPIQYRVTQEKATERPFSGEYLKLKDNGMYACVVCGVELFSSQTKYDSACGWPAFYDCIDSKKVRLAPDLSHVGSNLLLLAIKPDLVRTEVTCSKCGAHLGHLFDDGPKPTGKRYCINSAALKFKEEQSNNNGSTCEDKEEETNSLPSETTTPTPPPPTTTTITSTITSTKGIALDTSKSLPSSPTTIGTTGVERTNKTATSDKRLKFFNGQNKPVEDERKTSKYLIKASTVSSEVQSKTFSSSSSLSSSSSSLRRPSGPSPSGTNDSTSLANNLQAVKSRLKSVKTVKPVLVNSNNNNGVMHSTLETHL